MPFKADAPYTLDQIKKSALDDCLKSLKQQTGPIPDPEDIANSVVYAINNEIALTNACREKGEKLKPVDRMENAQIADCLIKLHHVCVISLTEGLDEDKSRVLGIYISEDEPKRGLYDISPDAINSLCKRYFYSIKKSDIEEIKSTLMYHAPRVNLCMDPDLIPVNNGIYNYKTQSLIGFDPKFVFTSKCQVDYNAAAKNPLITNSDGTEWDVESWIQSLTDNLPDGKEVAELIWEILGAMVRHHVPWNKAAFLVSPKGNNGKGTLCELMRSLLGPGAYANIPISNFGKEFLLEPLTHVNAIITDENDVGTYVDSVGNLKAIITGDLIQLNRKYKSPITFRFQGFMVQCLNDYPSFRDKTNSLYRRQLFIPMTKCFTGVERKYIKTDYVHRKDVLEYVLLRVLKMQYYELSEPESCKLKLLEAKEMNDPVLQFMNDVMHELTWDLVPYTFLYDLFCAWYKRNVPGKSPQARKTFVPTLKGYLDPESSLFPEWGLYQDGGGGDMSVRSKGRMDISEPLILEYDLEDWKNPTYKGNNPNRMCIPCTKPSYRGIIRKSYVTEEALAKEDQEELDKIMQLNSKANIVNSATEYATESQANTN